MWFYTYRMLRKIVTINLHNSTNSICWTYFAIFKNLFFFLKAFREGKGGRKRRGKTSMCGCLSCAPHWGCDLPPRHVLWLGIKPAALRFIGRCPVHWATPARAHLELLWALSVSSGKRVFQVVLMRTLPFLPASAKPARWVPLQHLSRSPTHCAWTPRPPRVTAIVPSHHLVRSSLLSCSHNLWFLEFFFFLT